MKFNVIMAGRNDDYGGGFIRRLSTSLNALAAQRSRHSLDIGVILVEWNPPAGSQRLADVIPWPDLLPGRIITVSEEIHKATPNSDAMAFLTHVAINAGIRRSTAAYILVVGAEIVLSDEMARFMATENLDDGCFYRAARSDLHCSLDFSGSLDALLDQCRQQVRITHNRNDAAGDFILMSRSRWHQLHGFQELRSRGTIDTYMVHLALSRGMREVDLPWAIYHQDHNRDAAMGTPQIGWRDELVGVANGDGWGLGEMELEERIIHD